MAALVVYASLYPFIGWRWPQGMRGAEWVALPWPKWGNRFDEVSNFVGYIPLGALLYLAVVRSAGSRWAAFVLALGLSAGLSYGVELAQQFLPTRVPSLKDCLFNFGGAITGALLAWSIHAAGYVEHWHGLRERWFERDSASAFVLLLLWPVALLFPAPAPLGLGHVWGEVHGWVQAALRDTPWADDAALWLGSGDAGARPLTRMQEVLILMLGLLSPCFVAYAITRAGWHRLLLVAGAIVVALGMMTMSTVLNFGRERAFAWWLPHTGPALLVATLLAVALVGIGKRWAAALGVVTLALLVALVAQAPDDPYFVAILAGWEQGRFVRFHGIAQWVGWLWPYAAMAWLLAKLTHRAAD
jgi:VanZ family protein